MWDLSGNPHVRSMWRYYYETTPPDALIFVIGSDFGKEKLDESREAFQQLLHDRALANTIKVVLYNIRDETDSTDSPLETFQERVKTALGLNDYSSSSVEQKVGIFPVRLGKALREDRSLYFAMDRVCEEYLRKRKLKI